MNSISGLISCFRFPPIGQEVQIPREEANRKGGSLGSPELAGKYSVLSCACISGTGVNGRPELSYLLQDRQLHLGKMVIDFQTDRWWLDGVCDGEY